MDTARKPDDPGEDDPGENDPGPRIRTGQQRWAAFVRYALGDPLNVAAAANPPDPVDSKQVADRVGVDRSARRERMPNTDFRQSALLGAYDE